MKQQRDAFITEVTAAGRADPEIMFLSADFGAPALDVLRRDLPDQFVHCGISEQNMIDLAAGLALDGRKVFCYAMAPFVSLRCLEQHKTSSALMDLPVCTIVAGIGLGYADAGPTHYATEDLACLRSLPGAWVYTASDAQSAGLIAKEVIAHPKFSFVRLDREADDAAVDRTGSVGDGYFIDRAKSKGRAKVAVVSQGAIARRAREAIGALPAKLREGGEPILIDLVRTKPFPEKLCRLIADSADEVLVVEEQTPHGGLFAAVAEACVDAGIKLSLDRLALPDRYFFENGGRNKLLEIGGIAPADIRVKLERMIGA